MSHASSPLRSLGGLARFASVAGVVAIARPVSAQLTTAIDLSSRSIQRPAEGWQSALAVSPFLRFDHPRLLVDGNWTLVRGNSQQVDGFGGLKATYFSPTRAGLGLSLGGFADRALLNETYAVSRFGADARLSYRAASTGAWLARELSRDNKATPLSPTPQYSAGVWRQLHNAIVTVSMSSFGSREGVRTVSSRQIIAPTPTNPVGRPDTLRNFLSPDRSFDTLTTTDSGSTARRRDWRDAEIALHWGIGRLALQGVIGTRFSATSEPNEQWGQLQGSLAVSPDLALIAAGGTHPSSAAYGIPRSRFVELGFRVAPTAARRVRLPAGVRPTPSGFEIRNGDRGLRTLRVRVPDARSVELSGDFTNWKPVTLARTQTDQWETTLAITPGMHRLAIRVNGESWTTPPGVPAIADEFQGTVGIIVVK